MLKAIHGAQTGSAANFVLIFPSNLQSEALRYIGEDVTWDDRPGTFVKNPKLANTLPEIKLADGESIHGELFPLVWSR